MNLFDSQTGKLKSKGSYGDIKNCNNSELKKALVQFWVAQFKDFRNTVNETKAKNQKKEEIEELAEFVLYNAINKLTKTQPQLVKEYLELSGLDGIDDAFTIEVGGNFRSTIHLKGCDVIVTLNEDNLKDAEQDINIVLGGVGRYSGIEGQIESAVTKLKTEKYTKKIQDTLNKLGLQDYLNKNDSVYFLDPQTEDIIFTCWKQNPNNYSKDNLIACRVKAGQPLHNNQDISYNNLPDFDKLKVIAVSTISGSSGRAWGTSDEIITYNPTIDDKLKTALGVHGKDSSNYAGPGNGQSVTVQNNVPDNLAKLGLTVREVYHSEYDSSD